MQSQQKFWPGKEQPKFGEGPLLKQSLMPDCRLLGLIPTRNLVWYFSEKKTMKMISIIFTVALPIHQELRRSVSEGVLLEVEPSGCPDIIVLPSETE
jgi:hypothetical protein